MAITTEQKKLALQWAIEITENFSKTGSIKCTPDEVLKDTFVQVVELIEQNDVEPFSAAVSP